MLKIWPIGNVFVIVLQGGKIAKSVCACVRVYNIITVLDMGVECTQKSTGGVIKNAPYRG